MVGAEAKNIFGSGRIGFWIGISNDGKFRYQSSGETAAWDMPYYDEDQKTGNIGTENCLICALTTSKWYTSVPCGFKRNSYTVCEIDN